LYLQDYAAGTQTVGKFLISTDMVRNEIAELRDDLIKKYKIPAPNG
jgi:hypothetical protein